MPIRLHDARSAALADLVPREGRRVGIYACGPTVYNRIHIGNARPFTVFSLLKRFLVHEGYDVTFVANITDVNDKIYEAARAQGTTSEALAAEMTACYVADTDGLGLGRPDHEPTATGTMAQIIALIATLIEKDAAYAVRGDVYFRVRADADYGSLSHRAFGDMDQGEPDPLSEDLKEDPLDFSLWKAQKEGEDTAWDAPWGRGRPGWHIECSAMAEDLLGVGFEIHGGGNDLLFPHHENEAAQTRAGRGTELAQIWMHNGMLQMGGGKMAKSVGNVASLPGTLDRWGRDAVILFFASAHYRQPVHFDDTTLAQAEAGVKRLREVARRLADGPSPAWSGPLKERFFAALRDDFNTPKALAAVWDWVRAANSVAAGEGPAGRADLEEMLDVLALAGLLELPVEGPPEEVVALDAQRQAARAAKDFAGADRLRDAIGALGWSVRDTAAGPAFDRVG